MSFSKEHLNGVYNWPGETLTIVFDGQPTRRLFDRYNGNQVLFVINHLMEAEGNFAIEHGQKLEELIINKLPVSSSSELTVVNWLQKELMVSA